MLDTALLSMFSLFTVTAQPSAPSVACDTWLSRVEAIAIAQGYRIEASRNSLSGQSDRDSRMSARCEQGHAELRVIDSGGASTSLEFTGAPDEPMFALELTGVFPGVGQVSQTHVLEAKGSELEGFMAFSAATTDDFVSVEFAADGRTISYVGDGDGANEVFAPVLRKSLAWTDTNVFLYGLAGMWDGLQGTVGESEQQAVFDPLFFMAIPTPHSEAADQDAVQVKRVCSASGTTCALSLLWPPAFVACGVGTAACLAAGACLALDCSGDDAPANS